MIGTKLAHYDITSHLGSGGMGEVYQATDSKLGRSVAIKLLPETFAHDTERAARFEREARVLASLNQPNIAAIYGIEQSNDRKFLVMELVDGETLAERIKRGPIPVDESLAIAKQICEALEAAHEKGIIHRDLKPANIKITLDGKVKVLDFGLAKMYEAQSSDTSLSHSPTLMSARTGGGVILGTAAYMSPEQARGRQVDRSTDTWALGCILYEMLSGTQAFGGETMTDILGSIVKGEPAWNALPKDVPARLTWVIRRCLQKNSRQRLRSAGDIAILLEDFPVDLPDRPLARRGSVAVIVLAVALVSALAGAGLALWTLNRDGGTTSSVVRLTVGLPAEDQLPEQPPIAISRDGALLAYISRGQLYIRPIDSLESRSIAGTDGAVSPFFSPDGQWIGFFAQGKLKKVSARGGAAQTLADAPFGVGGSWAADDTIYFSPFSISGISRIPASGGTAQPVTMLNRSKGEVSHRWPQILPGGKAVLFTVWTGPGWDEMHLEIQILATGERRVLIQGASTGRYVSSGHIVYSRAGAMMAVRFDLDRLELSTDPPVPLTEVVSEVTEGACYAVSDSGVIAYVPATPKSYERALVWVNRDGNVEPSGAPLRTYEDIALSPDGRRAAVTIAGAKWGIWLYDFSRATLTLLTADGSSQFPRWTPDGKRVIYRGTRAGFRNLFWKNADGSAGEERLTTSDSTQNVTSVSPDGKSLLFTEQDATTGLDIWVLPLDGDRKPRKFLDSPFNEQDATVSPNGRWVAYVSNESGRNEVYVRPFPGVGGKSQVSTEGGEDVVWSPNGRELFYMLGNKTMAVNISTEPDFSAESPRLLYEGRYYTFHRFADISSDARRFLRIQPTETVQAANQINVVINWFGELKQRVPVR